MDWDREADTVARGPNFVRVRPLVELLTEHDELPEEWPSAAEYTQTPRFSRRKPLRAAEQWV